MGWQKVPNNTRVRTKPEFKGLILEAKGKNTWNEFEKSAGISKHTIQNYVYGSHKHNPDITTLKKLSKNLLISAEKIGNIIIWDESLELLSFYESGPNDVILEKGNGSFIDLKKFCKGLKVTGGNSYFKFPIRIKETDKDHIKVWYKTLGGQRTPKEILIKRYISLDKETLGVFGLIQAEGTKQLKSLSFQFSNSNPKLILKILQYFEKYWHIPRNLWNGEVHYWRRDFKNKKTFLKGFWHKEIGIPKDKIKVREGTKYRLSDKSSGYGVCSLRMNSKTFSTIVLKLLYNIIHPLVKTNKKRAASYLRGVFEGDGLLGTHKGKLSYTGIAFNPNSKELEHYIKVLDNLDIKIDKEKIRHKNKRAIVISNWSDYYKLLKATDETLFLNERKNSVLTENFLDNQYVKPLMRLKFLKKHEPITAKVYSIEFGCTTRSALGSIKRLERLKFLKHDKNKQPLKFHTTRKCTEFLSFIEKLERRGV